MSEPVAIISSAIISEEELCEFIIEEHGYVDGKNGFLGRFTHDRCHIWVDLNPKELVSALIEGGKGYAAKLNDILGGLPKTYVTVEISRTPGSELMALDFAISFSARWPSVVDDLHNGLLARDELLRRRAAGHGFFMPT